MLSVLEVRDFSQQELREPQDWALPVCAQGCASPRAPVHNRVRPSPGLCQHGARGCFGLREAGLEGAVPLEMPDGRAVGLAVQGVLLNVHGTQRAQMVPGVSIFFFFFFSFLSNFTEKKITFRIFV